MNNVDVRPFIKKWNNKNLEDWGCVVSKDFKSFQTAFKNIVKKIATNINATLIRQGNGHYDMYGFIERNGKYVYYNYSGNIWHRSVPRLEDSNILIRTAKNDKDYTGGSNNYTSLENFEGKVNILLNN